MNATSSVIERLVDLRTLLKKKSHFLFGPRQTGKTFWIRQSLGEVKTYDLLDTLIYLDLSQNPSRIAQARGFNRTELNDIGKLVREHRQALLEGWYEFFGR